MSNINAENITVTNLNVTYINGVRYYANKCANPSTAGYYVSCDGCDDDNADATSDYCESCDYVAPEVDFCGFEEITTRIYP